MIVAISRSHARSYGDILVTAVTHHGIDLEIHKRGFSLARMAVGYERLHRVILEHPGRSTPERTGIRAV